MRDTGLYAQTRCFRIARRFAEKKKLMKKDSRIIIRTTLEQHEQIKKLAESYDLTLSKYLLLCALAPEKLCTPDQQRDLTNCIYELRKVGNNVNQIAHTLNILLMEKSSAPVNFSEIKAALSDISRVIKQLEK
jgi:hypothetical protein